MSALAFTQIADKLRRAARNQERLHLDYELVMAILTSPVYPAIAQLESEEIASEWQHSALDNSGSRGEPTEKNGLSAGTIAPLEPGVESQLASAISTAVGRSSRSITLYSSKNGCTENGLSQVSACWQSASVLLQCG